MDPGFNLKLKINNYFSEYLFIRIRILHTKRKYKYFVQNH